MKHKPRFNKLALGVLALAGSMTLASPVVLAEDYVD